MTLPWPRAALFDLDGTLVDSLGDIAGALGRLLSEEGLAPLDLAEVRTMVGDGAGVLVKRAFAAAGREPPADGYARFTALYGEAACVETRLYPGVEPLLRGLAAEGCGLAVATNKPVALAHAVLEGLGVAPLFQVVAGGDSYPVRKPHPDHLLRPLAEMGVAPDLAVMVGDGENDVKAAQAAGLPVLVCSFGYSREPVESLGADAVIDGFEALPDALRALAQRTRSSS